MIGFILFFVLLIALAVLLKITKVVFKILLVLSTLTLLLVVGFGILIFNDFKEFSKNAYDSVYYLSRGNHSLIAGFSINPNTKQVAHVENDELKRLSVDYKNKNYSAILRGHYKIFIVDADFLAGINKSVKLFEEQASFSDMISCTELEEDNELKSCISKFINKEEAELIMKENMEIRDILFEAVMSEVLSKYPYLMIEGISSHKIKVYPETPMFIAMKMVPTSLLRQVISKNLKAEAQTFIKKT